MNVFRPSLAPASIRRPDSIRRVALPSVGDAVASLRPDMPLLCRRPHVLEDQARRFVSSFAGDVLYAVKCNPQPAVLAALAAGGIGHFDAASVAEIRLVRRACPKAAIHFMHPIKARSAIREAFFQHGVRDFVLDSFAELEKILEETDNAGDIGLIVRLALPKGGALYDLSGKFGAAPAEAVSLLRRCRRHAARLGLSFHVGSQCLDPYCYETAIALAGDIVAVAGVALDIFDVGGGFPAAYQDMTPPPLAHYFASIERAVARLDLPPGCRLWCEPGRALVAAGQSLVVRVQARKGAALYVNDGVYGTLSDGGPAVGLRFPVRLLPDGARTTSEENVGFELFGPTCDSADRMAGPFVLPNDTREGDWIEVGQIGAYGAALRTDFNGFSEVVECDVRDGALAGWSNDVELRRFAA